MNELWDHSELKKKLSSFLRTYAFGVAGAVVILGTVFVANACRGSRVVPLMPTPVLYSELQVGPLDHVPEGQRWKPRQVYYATTRQRVENLQRIDYGNRESQDVSVGMALIGFGGPDMAWADLNEASRSAHRQTPVLLSITGLLEAGELNFEKENPVCQGAAAWFMSDINTSIRKSRDKDVLVYVHGAKVNFYNACAFTAQLDHFMGRDMTSIAFAWPTRQRITAYAFGDDVQRGQRSAPKLRALLSLLAEHSEARRIHVVAWSAGGRVLTQAVCELWAMHPDLDGETIRERYRLGTLYFAASDVPREVFIDALPILDSIAHKVIVTTSGNDGALKQAQIFMGGGPRIGQYSTGLAPEQLRVLDEARHLQVIDVSIGSTKRGFDITGHSYWINHPWASTDLVLAIRSDLLPLERGLVATPHRMLWGLPADYPSQLRKSMLRPGLEIRRDD